mmetsp:Transcript_39158/g.97178  ORF Transcript_39158/g.97178 Transcript_39158/m.97178 type:complete len:222 (+) Transcript_39158:30-695(+)
MLLLLPDELLELHLCHHIPIEDCVRLAQCARRLYTLVMSPSLAKQKSIEYNAPHCETLQQIAVHLATRDLRTHVTHKCVWANVGDAATLSRGTEDVIEALAKITLRHSPRMHVEVHSHTAAGNSASLAGHITQLRAQTVALEFGRQGLAPNQVVTTCWGNKVSSSAHWHTLESARSDLFVSSMANAFRPAPRYTTGSLPHLSLSPPTNWILRCSTLWVDGM